MDRASIDSTGMGHGNVKSYATGFILSVILTAFSFGLVILGKTVPAGMIYACIFGAAAIQILVHLHYFLHLDTSSKMRWNVLALILTVLIMILFVGGSMWIMSNLNYRMM